MTFDNGLQGDFLAGGEKWSQRHKRWLSVWVRASSVWCAPAKILCKVMQKFKTIKTDHQIRQFYHIWRRSLLFVAIFLKSLYLLEEFMKHSGHLSAGEESCLWAVCAAFDSTSQRPHTTWNYIWRGIFLQSRWDFREKAPRYWLFKLPRESFNGSFHRGLNLTFPSEWDRGGETIWDGQTALWTIRSKMYLKYLFGKKNVPLWLICYLRKA